MLRAALRRSAKASSVRAKPSPAVRRCASSTRSCARRSRSPSRNDANGGMRTMSAEGPPRGANSAPSGGIAAAKPQAWGGHSDHDILARILATKSEEVIAAQVARPIDVVEREARAAAAPRGFTEAIRACIDAGRPAVVAEI